MAENLDCLIIGGGPAGLTAAIYLARFHLKIIVADDGNSRALQIPLTRNHAGFPKGISGTDLLRRMRVQALKYGVGFIDTHIDRLQAADDGFQAEVGASLVSARSVLLATGVTNRRPAIPEDLHANALRRGQLRYCPVCDGYEVTDQDVAVIGRDARALSECIFLRSFTDRVTLVLDDRSELTDLDLDRVRTIGVTIVGGRPKDFVLDPSRIHFWVGEHFMTFDAIYPALGSEVHSELAASAGATLTEEGCVKVDAHQRTDVSGLYAAGDVVVGLDQISHAMGEAGVAATTIRNDLASAMPILR
ncbi:NAD(P)/FAD-dependent oxidoreductase [Bosea sp. NBC_00550]|uniref:NAD(P)/FAD-dependent oxidoreductase n=1 Tax=Bosea sp. NBC_00550 TaxID=2969621 RepID=UPI00222F4FC9|nr:NAD(P)/FAD-dependent oxidoreductase [Bosea sp. NBC_00550]UZF95617.1 NAD(P)/FAD-dependent oxidoreductase [Bosea sp. NBC_00550]